MNNQQEQWLCNSSHKYAATPIITHNTNNIQSQTNTESYYKANGLLRSHHLTRPLHHQPQLRRRPRRRLRRQLRSRAHYQRIVTIRIHTRRHELRSTTAPLRRPHIHSRHVYTSTGRKTTTFLTVHPHRAE